MEGRWRSLPAVYRVFGASHRQVGRRRKEILDEATENVESENRDIGMNIVGVLPAARARFLVLV